MHFRPFKVRSQTFKVFFFFFRFLNFHIYVIYELCGLARDGKALIQELETWFLAHGVMDAFGTMYPQYWL